MTSGPTGRCSAAREIDVCLVDGWRELPPERYSPVCGICQTSMDRQLDRIGCVVELLPVVARNEPTASGELHLPIVDLTLPGRLRHPRGDRDDQIGQTPVATALAPWVAAWHEAGAGDSLRISFRSPYAVVVWLSRHLSWACRNFDGIAEFAADLRSVYAAARRALSRDTKPARYAAPCRACGATALLRYPGHWIECATRLQGCGRLWDFADVAEDLADLRRETWAWQRSFVDPWEPMTTKQAAGYAGVPVGTIWSWVARGRLSPIRPVPMVARKLAPRYWPLEVDRCAAVLEPRERARQSERVERLARREELIAA